MKLNYAEKHFLFSLFCLTLSCSLFSTNYFVSPTGADANGGTLTAPFKTITKAYTKAVAGDVISLRAGTYRETVTLLSKSGTASNPITLTAYNGENAILSGLDVKTLSWSASSTPNVWVASYTGAQFEQLFCDSKPMLEARWPNVPLDTNGDWNFFSPDVWSTVDATGNSYSTLTGGVVSDAHLAATGWNITGLTAVLNVSHQFYTWTRKVSSHATGASTFTYPADLGASVNGTEEYNDDRYYLVGDKVLLDAPGEWFFDTVNKLLYFYPPAGKNPNTAMIEIKTRNFSFTADQNSNYLTVDGITFFGTAFSFGKSISAKSHHIEFQNNTILYSSWTECLRLPATDLKVNYQNNFPTIHSDSVRLLNNTFAYGTLNGLLINGYGNIIKNNLFHDLGYSSSLAYPNLEVGRNWATYEGTGGSAIVCNNTLFDSGGIALNIGQSNHDVYQNNIYNSFRACWGGNKDQSTLYTNNKYCAGTRLHHNWVHDSYAGTAPLGWGGGMGIRGDDSTTTLTVDHNVVWNVGSAGLELKNPVNPTVGMANRVVNNTIFQHSSYNATPSAMIVRTQLTNENIYSTIVNNMAQQIYGNWGSAVLGTVAAKTNNSTGSIVENLLENKTWCDFRPKSTAAAIVNKGIVVTGLTGSVIGTMPDIGAYERGDSLYFIPGKRSAKATFPIVPDSALSVTTSRDALMWRPAYNAVAHHLYFGSIFKSAVANATTASAEYKGVFKGENNVYTLPTTLLSNKSYFWRVDAVMADGTLAKGDVWSFSTGTAIADGSMTAAVSATVDAPFAVTFTENATWRNSITSIMVDGATLAPTAYVKTVAGKITFTPSASTLLQTVGEKNITVISTGFANSVVYQTIAAGMSTANSTASMKGSFEKGIYDTIYCIAKDKYNNVVPGYKFKYDFILNNTHSTTAETYTIDSVVISASASNILGAHITNKNGIATIPIILPAMIDLNDGFTLQVKLNDGNTNIGTPFTFTRLGQSLTFGVISPVIYGVENMNLSATSSVDLPVSYSSSNTSVATVNGNVLTIMGAGSTDITASQLGNGIYAPATNVTQTLQVNPKVLTVTSALATNKAYDGTTIATLTGSLSGVVGSDNVTFVGTGDFASSNIGTAIVVTSTSSLGGTKAANYTLTQPTGLKANITPLTAPLLMPSKIATAKSDFNLTFIDNALWRNGLYAIFVDGSVIAPVNYTVNAGYITIKAAANIAVGVRSIFIQSIGFTNAQVSQVITPATALPDMHHNSNIEVYASTSNHIVIDIPEAMYVLNSKANILNSVGSICLEIVINEPKIKYSHNLKAGIYFVQLLIDGKIETRKLVIY